jgi:FkbM family methyltransferase
MDSLDPTPPAARTTRKVRGFPLRLTFDPRTYLGRFLYYRGLYEDATMQFMRRILRPGMTFLDVGANIGLHTAVAAHLVGPGGRVLSVEPQDDLCDLVSLNCRQNGLTNVSIFRCALGRSVGTAVLHQLYEENPSAATLQLQPDEKAQSQSSVTLRTLSDLLVEADLGREDLVVKIDVEGAELEVLAGADEYFAARPPALILVECVDHHLQRFGARSVDLLKRLDSLGFRLSTIHRGRRIDVSPTEPLDADVIAWRPDRSPW